MFNFLYKLKMKVIITWGSETFYYEEFSREILLVHNNTIFIIEQLGMVSYA